jgi:ABC-type Fe3+/spermidine/putrescine transport system ATPase subunit
MILLSVQDLSAVDAGKTTVKHISFEQQAGEKIAIAGETGSGKTSLLKMIGGLMQPASGLIELEGDRVKGPDEQLIAGHPRIGYLSQHFELRNNYRVEELLDMANLVSEEEAEKIYSICDITHLRTRWTDELSGGEKQRISLAKLLTTSPRLLLLDEPYSNLDLIHKRTMKQVIEQLGSEMGISFILVSHDAADILSWADKIFFMRNGEIIQRGSAEELYHRPKDAYCAALLGPYNLLPPDPSFHLDAAGPPSSKLFFRPENINITKGNSGPVNGIVVKLLFWGNYYTVDVKVGKELVTVQSNSQNFQVGDCVSLEFLASPHWIA